MKQQQITIGNKTILVVDLPKDATDYKIIDSNWLCIKTPEFYWSPLLKLDGSWQLLGFVSELTEEQLYNIVETKSYGSHPGFCTIDYSRKPSKNGFRPGFCYDSGNQFRDSFKTLLKSNGILTVNPKPEYVTSSANRFNAIKKYNEELKLWSESQSQLWVNPVILVKK